MVPVTWETNAALICFEYGIPILHVRWLDSRNYYIIVVA